MLNLSPTYRIQFHAGFTFTDLRGIIPYLNGLGIKVIYASPIFAASPGSMHGYDVVDPHRINPEIGTLEELREIAAELKKLGIQWVQDIVPNHMAFHPDNLWLMDVLEKGENSDYYNFFDINWVDVLHFTPLMVPFLGSTLEEAIAKDEIKLVEVEGKLKLQYFDTQWPVNDKVTDPNTPVQEVVDLQYYRPCHWKETNKKINYRRFFTVNSLICLNIQDEWNFELYHQLIKTLVDEGVFQGVRVDHIDGLYDPETYLERLRELIGDETYIVVEKILEEGEELPHWPIEGTTGYEFLAQVNNLMTNRHAEEDFSRFYEELTGDRKSIPEQITEKKTAILVNHMGGELDNLYTYFLNLYLVSTEELAKLKTGKMKEVLGHLLIYCPVYRFYGTHLPLSGDDHKQLKRLLKVISGIKGLGDAVQLLEEVLLKRPKAEDESYRIRASEFYLRLMQFSGPLMAKGVEDTLMYTYHRFIGHNEVGDAPAAFGLKKKAFHQLMEKRTASYRFAMNATSTHDTKRGEDVRARLNVLTDLPEEWIAIVKEWKLINAGVTEEIDVNDLYFIYQTLIGSYPMPGMPEDNYTQRLQEYLQKALREGKVNSDWAEPDTAYEQTLIDFVEGILSQESEFWQSFAPFHAKVADYGILNSLTQVILKFTCPGIADVYQGTELWDLSLVDPDNRRPVDYTLRASLLEELAADGADGGPLPLQHYWEERYAGKIKLALIQRLLSLRDERNELFDTEYYIKLDVKGKHAKHVFAFARRDHKKWLITAVPLHLALLVGEEGFEFTEIDWEDTAIILPEELTGKWENLLNGASGVIEGDSLELNQIFEDFPLGLVFLEERESPRSAGILLHLTSLPSGAGIGDMGLMSMFFISYLESAKQQYWQLLPLNPISADQGYSPYSSVSAMAGNVLLIAGDLLMFDGLLEYHDYEKSCLADKGKVDFAKVEIAKAKMLAVAYENFTDGAFPEKEANFNAFKEREQDWLDAFALFMVFKNEHNGLPWFQWDPQYRDWDTAQSLKLKPEQEEKLEFIKWQQYVFFEQYARLKESANRSGIKLYGDLPFYVGHDSADVWSNRHLFSVDAEGKLIGVAGVPPDYFNAQGQLWGMPVYQWDNMKADGYSWWIKRIAKNMEMYNLLRLDHFRAFADYWEVPAGDTTAVNGVWKKGPGADFFAVLQKEFPTMPFVAEDLGEINQAVYALRDEFNLPGMKVLQFAFGEQVGQSDYIPHNYASENFVSYTGTHDNNTTLGWFKKEATKAEKQSLEKYAGRKVSSKNVVFVLTRMAYASVAKIVILPMQDVLELDSKARINTPGVGTGNWAWQLKQLPGPDTADRLRELVELFGRK